MEKDTRNAIQRATQSARALLEREVGEQLEGIYDILLGGTIPAEPGAHLDEAQRLTREKLVAAVTHHAALGRTRAEAVGDYLRETAFTTLNRFVALKMLEARELVQECVSRGDQSSGFREFCGLAPGLVQLSDQGYRLYLESLFDEIAQEVGILFDRRDPSSLVWPRRQALNELLKILNAQQLIAVWADDETIGWVYQYFNSGEERKQMRDESQAPRNSRELAVRNQFFTPRYVVRFLVDNTLARTWWQMRGGETRLTEVCEFLVLDNANELVREKKDPRDIKILDPACGSGHFLLYAFDLLETIYEESWHDDAAPVSAATGSTLRQDYAELGELHRALPVLILGNNLFGVEIDPRAAQIAALALWLRAQRAHRERLIPADERPRITRTHIVVAEPMPGDAALLETFAGDLQPSLLSELFIRMVSEMRLAGELGTLLRVDDAIATTLTDAREEYVRQLTTGHLPGLEPERGQEELNYSEIDDVRFFEEAEAMLLDALQRFAESASGGRGVRQWLFADDAAQGIAFIELVSQRFDVVLMNPPFGLMPRAVYDYLTKEYPTAYYDLAVAFLERGRMLLAEGGRCGAITTRAFMTVSDAEKFRRSTVRDSFEFVADLGSGVMDGAAVDASLELVVTDAPDAFVFWDVRDADDKSRALLEHARGERDSISLDREVFASIPGWRLAYDAIGTLHQVFSRPEVEAIEPDAGIARTGASTFEDVRFLRARWEVHPDRLDSVWMPISRTAEEFSLFYAPSYMVTKWNEDGSELCARNEQVNGQTAQARQGSTYYGRPGIVFSRRGSPSIAFRIHPQGSSFASTAGVVFPQSTEALPVLLAYLNALAVRGAVRSLSNRDSYTVGQVKKIRWPTFSDVDTRTLFTCANELVRHQRRIFSVDEADPHFNAEWLRCADSFDGCLRGWREEMDTLAQQKLELMCQIDDLVNAELGIHNANSITRLFGVSSADIAHPRRLHEVDVVDYASRALSVGLGMALGRWRLDGNDDAVHQVPVGWWAALPPLPPVAQQAIEKRVLVDDEGHPHDVVHNVLDSLRSVWPQEADESVGAMESAVGDLRGWFRRNAFAAHLIAYTRGKRRAPVYWQLSSTGGSYSVWLFLHAFDHDMLYRIQSDYVAPKLALEERRLFDLVGDAGSAATRATARQQEIVDEMRSFDDEIRRVAPLWSPDLDDGVLVNFAPLWRLVPQHPSWQKELALAWEEICSGAWDWAQLSMHLWPERVVPKCATDRSIAIAHGLEDVFWTRDEMGAWRPLDAPTVDIEVLIRQRASAAVKSALERLLAAPAPNSSRRGRRRPAVS